MFISRCFRDGDEEAGLAAIEELDRETQHEIYNGLNRGHFSCGEEAFKQVDLAKKCDAVDKVISRRVNAFFLSQREEKLPPGAIKLSNDSFYDCGFDPRYSFDGTYLLPEEGFCAKVRTGISEFAAFTRFLFRAYLSWNREESSLGKLILSCALTERAWARFTKKCFVYEKKLSCEWIYAEEYFFLKTVSEIYKAIHPDREVPANLFSGDLLYPIHMMNKSLDLAKRRGRITPTQTNWDLSTSTSRGFWRLSPPNKDYANLFPPTEENKEERKLYVFHSDFIEATTDSADHLKGEIRKLRTVFFNLIRSGSSFEECKQVLAPLLDAFQDSWNRYIGSHEVLQEAGGVFAIADPLKEWHTRTLEQIAFDIPILRWIHALYKQWFSTEKLETPEELNKKAFLEQAPSSLTYAATHFKRDNPLFEPLNEEEEW